MGSRGFSERYGRLGHIIGRQILEKKAEIYAFVDQVGPHRGTDNDFKAELSIADTELDRAELALKLEVMNVPRIVVHHHGGPAQCGSRLVVTTSWESGGDAGETEGHQDPPLRWRDAAQIRFAAAWRGTAPVGRTEQLCAPSI